MFFAISLILAMIKYIESLNDISKKASRGCVARGRNLRKKKTARVASEIPKWAN